MGIEFDPVNKYIKITSPTTTESALNIYCAAMDWADELVNMESSIPMKAVGKFDMGGGVYSDTIFQLINGWKLKFWSTTEHFIITGTLLAETPTTSRHVTPADVEYQVASYGTISEPVISESEKQDIADLVWTHTTGQNVDSRVNLIRKIQEGRWKIDIATNKLIIYDDDGETVLKTFTLSGEQTKAYSERNPD